MSTPVAPTPIAQGRRAIMRFFVGLLTKPLKRYQLNIPNDMTRLKRYIRKGDVILIEGNERISECVKYLTQSSWSHAALYVGDEPLRRDPNLRGEYREKFGDDVDHLVVEALVETGVVLSPLTKYKDFNIRVCRPYNLTASDLPEVLDEALRSVGSTYDLKNIFDLARYFLPVSFIPARFRRTALQFGSGEPTRVICSSLIASCFARVKFPITPRFAEYPDQSASTRRGARIWPIRTPKSVRPYGILRPVSPTLITPRDFDLSPYFEIIKFNVIEGMRFDYHKIEWAADEPAVESRRKPA